MPLSSGSTSAGLEAADRRRRCRPDPARPRSRRSTGPACRRRTPRRCRRSARRPSRARGGSGPTPSAGRSRPAAAALAVPPGVGGSPAPGAASGRTCEREPAGLAAREREAPDLRRTRSSLPVARSTSDTLFCSGLRCFFSCAASFFVGADREGRPISESSEKARSPPGARLAAPEAVLLVALHLPHDHLAVALGRRQPVGQPLPVVRDDGPSNGLPREDVGQARSPASRQRLGRSGEARRRPAERKHGGNERHEGQQTGTFHGNTPGKGARGAGRHERPILVEFGESQYDRGMFSRQRTGSVVCPSCGNLVGVNDERCYNCGRMKPRAVGLRASAPPPGQRPRVHQPRHRRLRRRCTSPRCWRLGRAASAWAGLMSTCSPRATWRSSLRRERRLSGLRYDRWWTVLSAGWLHGSALHILFNMMWMRQLGPAIGDLFGPSRLVIIYTAGSILGFLLSSFFGAVLPGIPILGGAGFTIGASAPIFGLLGALVRYGQPHRQQPRRQPGVGLCPDAVRLRPPDAGVDNWAHGGGFVGRVPGGPAARSDAAGTAWPPARGARVPRLHVAGGGGVARQRPVAAGGPVPRTFADPEGGPGAVAASGFPARRAGKLSAIRKSLEKGCKKRRFERDRLLHSG